MTDIKCAYINAKIEKEIYVTQHEGFVIPDYEDYVCVLLKTFMD